MTCVSSKQKVPLTSTDRFYLGSHIDTGIAKFTEHLRDVCARLEKIEPCSQSNLVLNIFPILSLTMVPCPAETKESREDLLESAQRILIWMGDLSRYRGDLGLSKSVITAHRLYQQVNSNKYLFK